MQDTIAQSTHIIFSKEKTLNGRHVRPGSRWWSLVALLTISTEILAFAYNEGLRRSVDTG